MTRADGTPSGSDRAGDLRKAAPTSTTSHLLRAHSPIYPLEALPPPSRSTDTVASIPSTPDLGQSGATSSDASVTTAGDDPTTSSTDAPPTQPDQSRGKKKRKKKKGKQFQEATESHGPHNTLPPALPSPISNPTAPATTTAASCSTTLSLSVAAVTGPTMVQPLLICSIGNPGAAYANTLHSAGHIVLAEVLRLRRYPPLAKSREFQGAISRTPPSLALSLLHGYRPAYPESDRRQILAHEGEDWTLWRSDSFMNVSGKSVAAALRQWRRDLDPASPGHLVVLHDELERPMGQVGIKRGGSPRGHNGLKSIVATLPRENFVRIGVGIGRPTSRDSGTVANYVLKKVTPVEESRLKAAAGRVIELLREVEDGKL